MDLTAVKAAVDDLSRTFAEFKTANDDALQQKADKGASDPITVEKVDKINGRMSAIEDTLKALKTAAEAAAAEAKAAREQAEAAETALRRSPRSGTGDDAEEAKARVSVAAWLSMVQGKEILPDAADLDLDGFAAYQKSFGRYLRKGQALHPDSFKALAVGSDPDGGYWVTPLIAGKVITRVFETSPVRAIASVMTIGTDAVEFPKDVDEAASGGWVAETGGRAETGTAQIGMHRIPVHEQYANPRVTQKLLDDAAFDVEGWLGRKVADILARTENTAFVSGSGVGKPRGFLDYGAASVTTDDDGPRAWGVLQYVPSGASGAFDTGDSPPAPADPLITIVHKLKPIYRAGATWTMNRATVAATRKLKDGQGNYLWSMGDIKSGQPATLLGFPLAELEDMPDIAADSFSIAFGDFRTGYQIVDRIGIRVLRDPYTAKPYIQFYTTKRVGADVVNFDAIKLFKFAAT